MKNNLKRILLFLPVISVLLVALAVPAFADYSPETGWSEPDAVVDGGLSVLLRTVDGEDVIDIPVTLYGYVITPDWNTVDLSKLPLGVDILPSDYEWYYLIEDVYDEAVVFRAKGLRVSDIGVTYAYVWINEGIGWQESQLNSGYWAPVLSSYPPPVTNDGLQFFSSFEFFVTSYPAPVSSDSVTSVWTEIMIWITSALNSVMGAFYVDGSLTLLGTLAVIGVSVGIGFLIIGLIQRFLHLRG